MTKMNNHISRILTAVLVTAALILGCSPSHLPQVSAAVKLNPYVLTTGSASDQEKKSHDTFDADGSQLIPLTITADGCLSASMIVQNPGYINVELHTKADGSDIPAFIACQCTADRMNFGTFTQYFKKGTYYLRFPKNSYILDLQLFPSGARTLKDKTSVAAYCDERVENTFTYKATVTGYITLSQSEILSTRAFYDVSLCDAKGKKLSRVTGDHVIEREVIFPVKKGNTYKIKWKAQNSGEQMFYQLALKATSRKENSGSSKSKAVKATVNQYQNGLICAEDAASKGDWYKFSNTKAQNLSITCSGFVSSGSIDFIVYNSKGKRVGVYHLMHGNDKTFTTQLVNTNGKRTLPKGTYYIKVQKTRKDVSGIYSFKIVKK